ncbi:hypothetical protein BCR33DRAFT_724773 [Rhizoclosmatium globosum]|uniref:mannan endo-1,6-alpha-mannosidase n=1 Tax=Rhizoclosmatium globosum TaxID=329046 RepID=A0A1Y2B463_9FUNG|nr:hypothetical protein BCR33DRAFT_724773 [Rhizoclosmatium globosum]|eukprot:ORY29267.1 hypothetical protein BCR33DRAFT_724773 [Rhizoclosmatium globosum]
MWKEKDRGPRIQVHLIKCQESSCQSPSLTLVFEGGRWVVQWHESGMYQDLFYQYALATGDGSNNGFADGNMYASAAGNGDFLGGFKATDVQDQRWNDDIMWWALSSISGAEATGNADLKSFASTTLDQVWMSWDDKCGGGIYWSRDREPGSQNPYMKSTITNVQVMDLAVRLGQPNKSTQIWNWLKSANLVVDNGNGGYIIFDRLYTNDCGNVAQDVYSYHAGEAMTALALQGEIEEATKVFKGLRDIFVGGDGILGPNCNVMPCNKNPSGYSWPVYKGMAYLYRATSDASTKSSIAAILKATATNVLGHCSSNWDCMRDFGAGAAFTLISPDGKNVRDQFEAVALLNAIIVVNGGGGFGPSTAKPAGNVTASATASTSNVTSSTLTASSSIRFNTAVAAVSTTTAAALADSGSSNNAGAIAGGVVGGLAGLCAIAAAVYYFYSKRAVNTKATFEPSENSQFVTSNA